MRRGPLQAARRWARRLHLHRTHMKLWTTGAAAVFLTLLVACTGHAPAGAATSALLVSLQATTAGDSAYFLLQVTNPDTVPVPLEFNSDPVFQFAVARGDLFLWNSAPDLTFTENATSDTLQAGDTRSYQASWAIPIGLRGTLTVTGVLHERQRPLAQSTEFRIP